MLHLSDWAEKVEAEVPGLVQEMLPPHLRPAAPEVWPYLTASLGDKTRIGACASCFAVAVCAGSCAMFVCVEVCVSRKWGADTAGCWAGR